MNLIIDIGNTRTKLAFFQKNTLIEKANFDTLTLDALSAKVRGQNIEGVIMSVSGQDTEGVDTWLSDNFYFIKLNHETPLPIKNQYETPQTLGKDRLAAAVAAHYLFPNTTSLVIDGGTALTYNMSDKGSFLGGNIAPGLVMRLKALHHFTAKLPLVARNNEGFDAQNMIGRNTEQAILNGVQLGILAEIEGIVARFSRHYDALQVIITGGDGVFLKDNLNINNIIYEPNLVLIGLNQILNHNLH